MSLRATYLEGFGEKIVIPNGQINSVINYSAVAGYINTTIPVPNSVAYKDAEKIIMDALAKFYKENLNRFLENPKVIGIESQDRFIYNVSIMCKVQKMEQWKLAKEIRAAIKTAFDKNKITY